MPSHVITRFTYDADTQQLDIAFLTGRLYRYADVPPDVGDAMRRAFAKGEFFNHRIRDRYPVTRMDAPASDLFAGGKAKD